MAWAYDSSAAKLKKMNQNNILFRNIQLQTSVVFYDLYLMHLSIQV